MRRGYVEACLPRVETKLSKAKRLPSLAFASCEQDILTNNSAAACVLNQDHHPREHLQGKEAMNYLHLSHGPLRDY